jgi:hypothetical protein
MNGSPPPVLVVFKMHGCPHCEAVSGPESACLGLENVLVLEIENNHPLPRALKVAGFPTLWLSQKDSVHEFSGARTTADIQKWIDAHLQL